MTEMLWYLTLPLWCWFFIWVWRIMMRWPELIGGVMIIDLEDEEDE